jgi:hypothetical protein
MEQHFGGGRAGFCASNINALVEDAISLTGREVAFVSRTSQTS